jgi:hypothetical protein
MSKAAKHKTTTHRSATWRRNTNPTSFFYRREWTLRADGRTYASIFHGNDDSYSCFAVCAQGHSHDIGPARDLASAKAYLSARFGP